jgi:hypothetical protein
MRSIAIDAICGGDDVTGNDEGSAGVNAGDAGGGDGIAGGMCGDGDAWRADGIHLTTRSALRLGRRLADAYVDTVRVVGYTEAT